MAILCRPWQHTVMERLVRQLRSIQRFIFRDNELRRLAKDGNPRVQEL
jgi:hypothetical protein